MIQPSSIDAVGMAAFRSPKATTVGSWFALLILLGLPHSNGDSGSGPKATAHSARLIPSSEPGWPQFRGPRRDGVCDETGLLDTWPKSGPSLVWSASRLGRGFSSPIVSQDRIFITGDVEDELRLFALDTAGRLLWSAKNGASWKTPYPGARATPAYSAGRLYHQNAHGRLACLDAETGREVWSVDLLERFQGENITWGLSECLLVDDRAVYATAGGKLALMAAFDKATGRELWRSEPLRDSEGERAVETASYVSPILVEFAGRRLVVSCSLKHLFCIDADTGELQWVQRMPTTYSVLAMTPLLVGDAIFMTAPHGRGGRLLRLSPPPPGQRRVGKVELWQTSLDTCQGGAIVQSGTIFASFYPGRKGWAAVSGATGEVLYQEPDFVKGSPVWADDRLYTLSENGWMRLLAPTGERFEVKGEFRLAEATSNDAWAHPVIHRGRLYLRYHEDLFCYDVSAKGSL